VRVVLNICIYYYFFFSSRRRHTRFKCDWSSDVCSSDLFTRPTCRRASECETTSPPERPLETPQKTRELLERPCAGPRERRPSWALDAFVLRRRHSACPSRPLGRSFESAQHLVEPQVRCDRCVLASELPSGAIDAICKRIFS